MIRCIAIDDEPLALKLIDTYSQRIPFLELVGSFTDAKVAEKFTQQTEIDLLFLDIQMPEINGLNYYKAHYQDQPVIFTTAFSEYAIEGFEVKALDYLLKPYTFVRFEQACLKARDFLEYKNRSQDKPTDYMMVKQGYGWEKVKYDEILYLESRDDYVKLVLENNKHVLTKSTTKSMLEKLPDSQFIRVHRSYIVNKSQIKSVNVRRVLLVNDKEIPVGSNYKDFFDDLRVE